MEKNKQEKKNRFQKVGLCMAGLFYLVSVVAVCINVSGRKLLDPSLKTITFAHWQLEDGFREGYDEAIKQFEAYKAKQGEKVKVIQTTVPVRGYKQWFLTQLIGGAPADVIELTGSSEQHNQYFTPLSPYIGKPNPFNKGTPYENTPWKDTFHDNMNSALDANYGEYYGIGCLSAVSRIYVNLDLLEKATGSRKMPNSLQGWLDACKKLREYGKKIGQPIIPVGVRGFDKATLNSLFNYYFSQLNSDMNDDLPENCNPTVTPSEILSALVDKRIPAEKLYSAVDIITDIGSNFGEGFIATDLEQTKFLFFAGKVGFFPEGTWNAYSMVNNSPFEVGIMQIPAIGKDEKYSKYYVGLPTEQGLGVGGKFGIPKGTKHFDLSLEFLQFVSSWKVNQMIMVDYCKWLPAVKNAEYKGILQYCKPQVGSGRKMINPPFYVSTSSRRKMLESLETIIIEGLDNPEEYFKDEYIRRIPLLIEECQENYVTVQRALFSLERQRSAIAVESLATDLGKEDKSRLTMRYELMLESLISSYLNMIRYNKYIDVLERIQKMEGEK